AAMLEPRLALRCIQRWVGDLDGPVLFVGPEGEWVAVSRNPNKVSAIVQLPQRRVLLRLVEQRVASRGEAISSASLIEHAWPGERINPTAARNRLHVAIAALRRFGLRDAIEKIGQGYRLLPSSTVLTSL